MWNNLVLIYLINIKENHQWVSLCVSTFLQSQSETLLSVFRQMNYIYSLCCLQALYCKPHSRQWLTFMFWLVCIFICDFRLESSTAIDMCKTNNKFINIKYIIQKSAVYLKIFLPIWNFQGINARNMKQRF